MGWKQIDSLPTKCLQRRLPRWDYAWKRFNAAFDNQLTERKTPTNGKHLIGDVLTDLSIVSKEQHQLVSIAYLSLRPMDYWMFNSLLDVCSISLKLHGTHCYLIRINNMFVYQFALTKLSLSFQWYSLGFFSKRWLIFVQKTIHTVKQMAWSREQWLYQIAL